jgi:glycerophosphoryl diester phosphodiesterase
MLESRSRPDVLAGRPRPYVMAHRGDSDHAPENTLAAFRLAAAAGADIVETDLWFTADGQMICHHDATLERMTGDPRRVNDVSLAEIRSLEIRSRFAADFPAERIPTLAEVLAAVPPHVVLALELKDPRFGAGPAAAETLCVAIAERIAARTVFVISFDLGRVLRVKAAAPDCRGGHISAWNPLPTQPTELLGPYWTLLAVNPFYVRLAHRRGQWVCPLDPELGRRLGRYLAMDVDAVLTNDPGGTRARIEGLRKAR